MKSWTQKISMITAILFAFSGSIMAQVDYMSIFGDPASTSGCAQSNRFCGAVAPPSIATPFPVPTIAVPGGEATFPSVAPLNTTTFFQNSMYSKGGDLLFSTNTNGIYDKNGTLAFDFTTLPASPFTLSSGSTTLYLNPTTALSEIDIFSNPGQCNSYYVAFWAIDGSASSVAEIRCLTINVDPSTYALTVTDGVIADPGFGYTYIHYSSGAGSYTNVSLVLATDNLNSDGTRDIYTVEPSADLGVSSQGSLMRKWTIPATATTGLPHTSVLFNPVVGGSGYTYCENPVGSKAKILSIPTSTGATTYKKYLTYISNGSSSTSFTVRGNKLAMYDIAPATMPTLSTISGFLPAMPATGSYYLCKGIYGFEYLSTQDVLMISYTDFTDYSITAASGGGYTYTGVSGGLGYFDRSGGTTFLGGDYTNSYYPYKSTDLELDKNGDLLLVYDPLIPSSATTTYFTTYFGARAGYLAYIPSGFSLSSPAPVVCSLSCGSVSKFSVLNNQSIGWGWCPYNGTIYGANYSSSTNMDGSQFPGYYLGSQIRGENYSTGYDLESFDVASGHVEIWTPTNNPVANALGTSVSTISIQGDVHIHAAGLLSIQNMTIEMGAFAHIYVDESPSTSGLQGGELDLVTATLTRNSSASTCDYANKFWGGVVLGGDPSEPQLSRTTGTHQALISMLDYSTISYAQTGILASGPPVWYYALSPSVRATIRLAANGGGIVNVDFGSQFLNNMVGVQFNAYKNFAPSSPTVEIGNASYIRGASFNITDNAVFSYSGTPIAIQGNGIMALPVLGCDIENNTNTMDNTYGILSTDMSFTVDKYTVSYTSGGSYTFPSIFKNFATAIQHNKVISSKTPVIRYSTFTNNYIGVDLEGSVAPIVAYNTFNIPPWWAWATIPFPTFYGNNCIGVLQNGGDAYIINGNTFQNTGSSELTNAGVVVYNTGGGTNKVNNNTYTFIGTGNLSNFVNTNCMVGAYASGLQFICNTHSQNYYDMAARGTDYTLDGMRSIQGTPTPAYPGANVFSANSGSNYNIYNPGQYSLGEVGPVTYWYSTIEPATEHPGVPNGATAADFGSYTDCQVAGLIASDICTPSIGLAPLVFDGRTVINDPGLNNLSVDDQIHVAINNVNFYMNDPVGSTQRSQLYYWAGQINSPGGAKLLASLYLEDGNIAAANAVYNNITTQYQLNSLEQTEYNVWGRQLMDLQIAMMNSGNTTLTPDQEVTLQNIYSSSSVWNHCLARNWIFNYATDLVNPLYPPYDVILYPELPNSPKKAQPNTTINNPETKSRIAPNPATNEIYVEYILAKGITATITIDDVTGRELIKQTLQSGNTTIDVSGLPIGLYLYTITASDNTKENGKFIKN